jgi:hypothetical protein
MLIELVPQLVLAEGASKFHGVVHSTVLAGMHVMLGGAVITKVTICVQVLLLPHASVARQVRVALNVFPQKPVLFVTVLWMLTELVPQVSLAVGPSKFQLAVQSTVLLGTQVMVGAVVSTTVTVWLQSEWLPHASVARQVLVALKVFPQKPLTFVTVVTMLMAFVPQVSLALGASKFQRLVHSTVLLGTQAITGAVVSTTVTVWLQSA